MARDWETYDDADAEKHHWTGYNSRPMGSGNPYEACVGCGRTDPEINGDIRRHGEGCSEVQRYRLREFVVAHGGNPDDFKGVI